MTPHAPQDAIPLAWSTISRVLPRSGALLRHQVTSRPSALFSLFFPKFTASEMRFAAEIIACGQSGLAKNSSALRCFSLLFAVLILIETAWYFADLHTPSSSLAQPQGMGSAGRPVFAENLHALTFRLRLPRAAFNTSYCCPSCRRKLPQKYAIVN